MLLHSSDVQKGMVDKVEPWDVGEQSAAYLQDMDLRRPGRRTRRLGVQSIGGRSDGGPYGLGRWRITAGAERLIGIWNGKAYRMTGGGFVAQICSGASAVNTLHQVIEGRWNGRYATVFCSAAPNDSNASLASNVFVVDSEDSASQAASMSPLCATWFQDRLWAAGNTRLLTTDDMWWSSLDDPLSWSANNSIRVEAGVGGRITALQTFGTLTNDLIIFKQRAIFVFTPAWGASHADIPAAGDALDLISSNLRVLSSQTGCIATRSIQQLPTRGLGDLIFLSLEGFRILERSQFGTLLPPGPPLSDPILKTILTRVNFSQAHKAVSAVLDNRYFCAVPLDGATENTHVLVFDFVTQGWSIMSWAPRDLATTVLDQQAMSLFMQNLAQTTDSGVTGTFAGYHAFRCFAGNLDPSNAFVPMQEDTRGFLPGETIGAKHNWVWVALTLSNDAGATSAVTIAYNIDKSGWVTAGSMYFPSIDSSIVLGTTPLPWQSASSRLVTRYLSLGDVPPGHEIQFRYLVTDRFSLPTVHTIAVKATPIGYEYDNLIG